MNTKKTIFLIIILISINRVFAQNNQTQKIIITSPQAVIIDSKLTKKLHSYEQLCIKSTIKYMSLRLDTILLIDTLPTNERIHFEALKGFVDSLSIKNVVSYNLANSLQSMTFMSNKNQSYIPINYSKGITKHDLERTATEYEADYVLFIDTVRYLKYRGDIILKASLNLYDNIMKDIIYKHISISSDAMGGASSTCKIDKKKFTIYNQYTYDYSQIYRLLSKESEVEERTTDKNRRDYLLSIHNDSILQSKIKYFLYSNTDTTQICDFYRGIMNEDSTKFFALCIKRSDFFVKDTRFPSYLSIICTGTLENEKWNITVGSKGSYSDSDEPKKVKQEIFLRLQNTKLFIKDSEEINPDFWIKDEYKKIKFLL